GAPAPRGPPPCSFRTLSRGGRRARARGCTTPPTQGHGGEGGAPRRHRSFPAVLAALIVGALIGPSGCRHPDRPNVLIVTVDTLRADHLGCYGFGLAQTPAIDGLAREGVRCTDAASSAPITLPAH